VIHNFNTDGFDSLYPKYKGGRPKTFTLPERREIKKIAKSKSAEHDLPFSTWSLTKLADLLVAEGVVDDISHEGLRILLRAAGDLQPLRRGTAPVRRPGPDQGQALRPHQAGQEAHPIPGVLPLPAHALPNEGADRNRL
jgi:transposase